MFGVVYDLRIAHVEEWKSEVSYKSFTIENSRMENRVIRFSILPIT